MKTLVKKSTGEYVRIDDYNDMSITMVPKLINRDCTLHYYIDEYPELDFTDIELVEVEMVRKDDLPPKYDVNGHWEYDANFRTYNFIINGKYSNHDKELLEKYTKFLLDNSYVDCDVYCEPPSAIDRFMFPELNK